MSSTGTMMMWGRGSSPPSAHGTIDATLALTNANIT